MKHRLWIAALLVVLVMTGCGGDFPELSEEQESMIGEYAAITLLKYDANAKSRLVDESLIRDGRDDQAEIPEESATEESVQETVSEESTEIPSDIPVIEGADPSSSLSPEAVLGLPEGIVLTYRGYDVQDSFDAGMEYVAIDAKEGNKLLTVAFLLQNQSNDTVSINMNQQKKSFQLKLNGQSKRSALTTILDADLTTYVGMLEANGEKEVALIFEFAESEVSQVESAELLIKNATDSCTVTIPVVTN